MGQRILDEIFGIATAIIGIAIVAVIVSKKSDSANVITSAGKAFSNIVSKAVSPIS